MILLMIGIALIAVLATMSAYLLGQHHERQRGTHVHVVVYEGEEERARVNVFDLREDETRVTKLISHRFVVTRKREAP